MAAKFLLGVDIGTYSSKGVLVGTDDGQVRAAHVIEHDLSLPQPRWVEHDADQIWWGEFVQICQHILGTTGVDPGDILGIGVSGIGPCVLPVDEGGRPLRPGILYGIDTRAKDEIQIYEDALGEDAIFQLSGSMLSSSSIGPKIMWIKNHEPEIYQRARWFLTSHSYIVYRLTGEATVDIYSACSYAPLMDIESITWLDQEVAGMNPRHALPKMLWSCEVAGTVTPQAARQSGLAEGTPVIAGSIDAAAEAVSAGVSQLGDMMMMFGSSNSLIVRTDRLIRTRQFWGLNWLMPGTYAVVGGMSTVGSLTRWFRDQFSPLERQAEAQGGEDAYAALMGLLHDSPLGANGLVALPYFQGERTPFEDPDARGVLFGLTLKHSRADVYRALLESVGFGVRHNVDVMSAQGVKPQRILGVGGGTKNRAWMQMICDIANVRMAIPKQQIGASYGDALMAGVGAGVYHSLDEIQDWIEYGEELQPDPEKHRRYQPLYEIYRQLYEQTQDLMHKLPQALRPD
jgi:xylulokinase